MTQTLLFHQVTPAWDQLCGLVWNLASTKTSSFDSKITEMENPAIFPVVLSPQLITIKNAWVFTSYVDL